jgi:PAS domain S-box-containing protein
VRRFGDAVLETLLQGAPWGFAVLDRELRFIMVNRRLAEMNGLPASEHVGRHLGEVVPNLAEAACEAAECVFATGKPVFREFCGDTPATAGETRYWSESWYPVRGQEEKMLAIGVIVEDITERKRTHDALRESEERFRLLVEASAQAVWETDPDGVVVYDSPSWRNYTGQTIEEAQGYGWLAVVHPEDRDHARRVWRQAVETRSRLNAEFRLRRADGGWRWTNVHAAPVLNSDGTVRKWVGMNIDMTERKAAEQAQRASESALRESEERLRLADRRKDEFLATLAHELRNPVTPLVNGLELMRRAVKDNTGLQRTVEMMDRQLNHLVRLVEDLLDVRRITAGKIELRRKRVRISHAVEAALEATRPLIEARRQKLVYDPGGAALWVDADPDRLSQVFSNLLSNAAKYTDVEGTISVRLSQEPGAAVVQVSDTGIGIPAQDLPQIFELFSQVGTHQDRAAGGLGIGLSLVKRLVDMHGGNVTAVSAGAGLGSTFTVRLPLAAS